MFESKESSKEKRNTISWKLMKWYWTLIPTFYLLFAVPTLVEGSELPLLQPGDILNVIFRLLNISLAGIVTQIHVMERSKTGVADNILKAAIVQQFLAQNIFGIILSFFAWYRLPHKVHPEMVTSEEKEKWHFQPKTLYILMGIVMGITILSIAGQLLIS